jgi:hypothetical protein
VLTYPPPTLIRGELRGRPNFGFTPITRFGGTDCTDHGRQRLNLGGWGDGLTTGECEQSQTADCPTPPNRHQHGVHVVGSIPLGNSQQPTPK